MSAWLHLRVDIMQEFYEQGLLGKKSHRPRNVEAWLVAHEERKRRFFRDHNELRSTDEKLERLAARSREMKARLARGENHCVWCGTPIVSTKRWGPFKRVFCSKQCHWKLTDSIRSARCQLARQQGLPSPRRRTPAPRNKNCKTCGEPITNIAATGKFPLYCSGKCRPVPKRPAGYAQALRAKLRLEGRCGSGHTLNAEGRCDTCRQREADRRGAQVLPPSLPCKECGVQFLRATSGQRFCSLSCGQTFGRRRRALAERRRRAGRSPVSSVCPDTASQPDNRTHVDSQNTLEYVDREVS